MIDLRSDSSSTPTDLMRQAMANAKIGNDAFQEDPTVNALERKAATLLGKEEGLFVASGTMGNLVPVLSAAKPGETVLAGRDSHFVRFEAGAPARLGGFTLIAFPDEDGKPRIDEIRDFMELPKSLVPRVFVLENTHNSSGGMILSLEEMKAYAGLAKSYGLHLHLDGARIFNAAEALQVPASEIAQYADSVAFCLTKCLSAPVGSILVGKHEFIAQARNMRFMLGGQMRQAGVIAAAGLVALETMLPQIAVDHQNARTLAKGLSEIDGIRVDLERVRSNIVLFDVSPLVDHAQQLEDLLERHGVYASVFSSRDIRYITYRDIDADTIEQVLSITAQVAQEIGSS